MSTVRRWACPRRPTFASAASRRCAAARTSNWCAGSMCRARRSAGPMRCASARAHVASRARPTASPRTCANSSSARRAEWMPPVNVRAARASSSGRPRPAPESGWSRHRIPGTSPDLVEVLQPFLAHFGHELRVGDELAPHVAAMAHAVLDQQSPPCGEQLLDGRKRRSPSRSPRSGTPASRSGRRRPWPTSRRSTPRKTSTRNQNITLPRTNSSTTGTVILKIESSARLPNSPFALRCRLSLLPDQVFFCGLTFQRTRSSRAARQL